MEKIIPKRALASLADSPVVENPPGILRTTLSYNEQSMLCHFRFRTGAQVPLHHHAAVQNGYVISGRVRFRRKDGSTFDAGPGSAYAFGPDEEHGAEAIEDSELIEYFSPMRPEYGVPLLP
ncbi:cupin domain-containing protein [Salinispira pacifica]